MGGGGGGVLLVFVCWTLAGSSGLWYWSPGGQLTSLTGPHPSSPSASLSADDRRIARIQPQGSPTLTLPPPTNGLILLACAFVCPPSFFSSFFSHHFFRE